MIPFIKNHYREGAKRPKLCTEQHVIWEPTKEWFYAHHAPCAVPYICKETIVAMRVPCDTL